MYLVGDPPADLAVVLAELNQLILKDLNAELNIEYISWGEFDQRYPLILASGEVVDLIYTSDWAYYVQEVAKEAFVEVTDEIITQYMPLEFCAEKRLGLYRGNSHPD